MIPCEKIAKTMLRTECSVRVADLDAQKSLFFMTLFPVPCFLIRQSIVEVYVPFHTV